MGDKESAAPAVYAAICAATTAFGREGIAKNRRSGGDGGPSYNFRGAVEVMNAASPILTACGLCVLPGAHKVLVRESILVNAKPWTHLVVEVPFTLAAMADGSSVVVGPFLGEARDNSDKAAGKAMTYAWRTMMEKTFCIPTEAVAHEDTEQDTPVADAPAPKKHTPLSFPEEWEGAWDKLVEVYGNFEAAAVSEAGWQKICADSAEHGWSAAKLAEVACFRLGVDGWEEIKTAARGRIRAIFTSFEAD